MARLKKETETVNHTTGEVFTTSKTFAIKLPSQDAFFMTYIDNMSGVFKVTSTVDNNVLRRLCSIAGYNTGEVSLDTHTRKGVLDFLKISSSQLSRSLTKLKSLELISGDQGYYIINPMVFWKGSNDVRNKIVKDGFEIKVSLGSKNETI